MYLAVNNLKDYSYLCKLKKRLQMNQDIRKLVEKYEADRNMYLTDRYNETLVRSDFLDPLFGLLGWDIKNKAGKPTNEREVILEEPLKAGASENTKKPDYTFRLFAERKFFLEAKKPWVSIDKVDAPARQARRYGYTANLKISVLSNFEYLMIYDASVKVEETDTNQKADSASFCTGVSTNGNMGWVDSRGRTFKEVFPK